MPRKLAKAILPNGEQKKKIWNTIKFRIRKGLVMQLRTTINKIRVPILCGCLVKYDLKKHEGFATGKYKNKKCSKCGYIYFYNKECLK